MCYVIVRIFIFVTSFAKKSFFKLDKIEGIEHLYINEVVNVLKLYYSNFESN